MANGSVKDLVSKTELDEKVKIGQAVIIHFWASWCDASKQMDQVFSHLSTDFPQALFLRVPLSLSLPSPLLSLSPPLSVFVYILLGLMCFLVIVTVLLLWLLVLLVMYWVY